MKARRIQLTHYFSYMILKFVWILATLPLRIIWWILRSIFNHRRYNIKESNNFDVPLDNVEDEVEEEEISIDEEILCPEFAQIFELGDEFILGIESIIRCPEETALVRVVGEDTISPQYKRKIYYTNSGGRYIKMNNKQLYLKEKVQAH